jgi:hypothetical protein
MSSERNVFLALLILGCLLISPSVMAFTYVDRLPINSTSYGSGSVTKMVLLNDTFTTIGGDDKLIRCKYTVPTTRSVIGYLIWNDSANFECVDPTESYAVPKRVDQGVGQHYLDMEPSLVLWLTMNDTTPNDFSNYMAHTQKNGDVFQENGKIGNAINISGTASSFINGSDASFPTGDSDRAVTVWINPNVCPVSAEGYIFYSGSYSLKNLWGLSLDNLCHICIYGYGLDKCTTALTVPTGTWSFIAVSYNSSTSTLSFYKATEKEDLSLISDYSTILTGQYLIGSGATTSSSYEYNGFIDDLKFYNRTLSDDEIKAEFNNTETGDNFAIFGEEPAIVPAFVNPTPLNASYTEGNYIYVNVSQTGGIDNCILTWTEEIYDTNETMTVNGDYCYLNLTSFTGNPIDIQVYVNESGTLSVTEKRRIYPMYCGVRMNHNGQVNLSRDWSCTTTNGIFAVQKNIDIFGNYHTLSTTSSNALQIGISADNVRVHNLTIDTDNKGIQFLEFGVVHNYYFYNVNYFTANHGNNVDTTWNPYRATFYDSTLTGAVDAGNIFCKATFINSTINGSHLSVDTFDNMGISVNTELYFYDSTLYGAIHTYDYFDSINLTIYGDGRTYCLHGSAGSRPFGMINSNLIGCYIGVSYSVTSGGTRTGNYFNSTIGWEFLSMGLPTTLGLGNLIASKSDGGNGSTHPYGQVISDCVNLSSGSLGQILRQSCDGQTSDNIATYTISMDSSSDYNTFSGMTAEYAFDWGGIENMINNSQINNYINLTNSVNLSLVNVTVPVINNVGDTAKYFRDYYLQLRVIDQNGNPLNGVTVNVADTFATNKFSGSIDERLVKNFHKYYDNLGVVTNFEPYTVTASKVGYITNSTNFVFASDAIITLQLTAPPNINMTSPEPRVYAKYLIDLNVSADQPIDKWWYNLNGTGNVTFIPNITLNLTSMGDGDYYIYVYGNNSVGMVGSDYENWSIDTTKPIVFITSPANGTKTNTLGMTIYGIAENIHLDTVWTDSIYFTVNSGTLENWNFTNSSLPEGTYTVNVYANDSLAFVNMKTVYFTLDRTNPVITILSPTNVTYPSATVLLNASSNETITLWFYTLNGAGNYTFTPNTTITGATGHNVLHVYGIDEAGNIGMEISEFDVAVPPTPVNSGLLASIPTLASLIMLLGGLLVFTGMALSGEIKSPKEIAYALIFLMIILVLAIQLAGF